MHMVFAAVVMVTHPNQLMKNEMLIRNENSSEQPIVGSSATKSEYSLFTGFLVVVSRQTSCMINLFILITSLLYNVLKYVRRNHSPQYRWNLLRKKCHI